MSGRLNIFFMVLMELLALCTPLVGCAVDAYSSFPALLRQNRTTRLARFLFSLARAEVCGGGHAPHTTPRSRVNLRSDERECARSCYGPTTIYIDA